MHSKIEIQVRKWWIKSLIIKILLKRIRACDWFTMEGKAKQRIIEKNLHSKLEKFSNERRFKTRVLKISGYTSTRSFANL